MNSKTKIILSGLLLSVFCFLSGCSDDDSTNQVYFPQGQKALTGVFSITDEPYILKYTVSLAGADYATVGRVAENDIIVNFEIDMALVDQYNKECNTNYLPMPDGSYNIPSTAVIVKGKSVSDSVAITIDAQDKFESFVPYMLPIRITQVNGGSAYPYQQILYVGLSGVADAENIQLYDRSAWQIIDFSTEEPAEGGGNGLAKCMIDDDPDTYWHSKWAGGEAEPPHHISIDMGEERVLHGIALMNRYFEGDWAENGHGQPKNITVSISTDGKTWTENGKFTNLPIGEGQPFRKFFFNQYNKARYMKIIVTEPYIEKSTSIAEIGAF
ncbi:MAG: DUF1735 domain-containing protein [Dysgonomonas sp.]|nr:DUF1735 domain-containing protein [Dysgonomonas sp.]